MRKLRLDLDALDVQSFETAAEVAGRGTVHARADTAVDPAPLTFEFDPCGPLSGAESCVRTCISCPVATDPCICDPIRPLGA